MKNSIELLAPGGDLDAVKAAIAGGADAIYCGLERFNARNRATNITLSELPGVLRLAHENDCELFITLNIIFVESEFPALFRVLNSLATMGVDGVIVQDLGLLYILSHYFPALKIHASTQLTSHNQGQIRFLTALGIQRVNLCRELSLGEIGELTEVAHGLDILTEIFVHGSLCLSFSGLCYLSSFHGGNSGNRGRCSQPCRDRYETDSSSIEYPLNLKDNSAFSHVAALAASGVDSLKIEGRIKKFHYVYTVVRAWRKQLQRLYEGIPLRHDKGELRQVFNRDLSDGYLRGNRGAQMFIDNPRDNSALHLLDSQESASEQDLDRAKGQIYDLRTEIIEDVKQKIQGLSVEKIPLTLRVSGRCGDVLALSVTGKNISFVLHSDTALARIGSKTASCLGQEQLAKRLSAVNDTAYTIQSFDLEGLEPDLFIPHSELNRIRDKILFVLHGSRQRQPAVEMPRLSMHKEMGNPRLSVLLSADADFEMLAETEADLYVQLPSHLGEGYSRYLDICRAEKAVIPCFPPVLIGDEYACAVEFLHEARPSRIVTDNSGIAGAAAASGIPWIAGPSFNSVNSWSLLCLKEQPHCCGAFVSGELSRVQIKRIMRPEQFNVYYSIFHPPQLMTSRLCLLQGLVGCHKETLDAECLAQCARSSVIHNGRGVPLLLSKRKGHYPSLYGDRHVLNTDIITDVPGLFHSFFIDLQSIKTHTECRVEGAPLVRLFEALLRGESGAADVLHKMLHLTDNGQYQKGI